MSQVKITEKEGQTLVENYLKTEKVKFIKYELSPISEVAEGYMGEHYNVRVTYLHEAEGKAHTIDFFMKHTPMKNKHQAEIANSSNVYAREIFLYDVLFKEFQNFGFDTSFAAESFYCIPNKAIIMENLKTKGYITLERNKNFTQDHLKCALRALAAYHGAGFAYQKTKSLQLGRNYKLTDDYDEFLEENFFHQYVTNTNTDNKAIASFWTGCKKTFQALVDLLPQDEHTKKKFKNYLTDFKLGKVFAENTKYAKTLGHGDLWSNNILFQIDDEGNPMKCCLCDYQILRYFYPSFDVMLIIYSNTDSEFRRQHFQELSDYYYDTLTEIYRNYGFQLNDIMRKEDYEETFEMLKIDMLYQVASVSAITCIPKEILDQKNKNDGDFQEAFFDNYKISVKAFQESEIFRKVLSELLTEMYDTFESKS